MERYELVVIGGGPGGYVAAIRAAQLGKKVALVEKNRVGGTCLNRGCIPTKALMHSAEVLMEIKEAETLGIKVPSVEVDFSKLHERKAEVVEKLVTGVEGLIKANGIDFYSGTAKVKGQNQIEITKAASSDIDNSEPVGTEVVIEGDYIILATGSRPTIPPIPGLDLEGVVTSDDILIGEGLETDSLIIIGGGVIGVEIASIYRALGTEVTIIEAMDRILPTLDKEISQNLNMILKKRGVSIHTGARVEKVVKSGDELTVEYIYKEKNESSTAKNVLVCIGRRPNTEELFDTPPEMERGFVVTDEMGKTTIDNIYAIGDIVLGGIQLAHAASAEGINAVEGIFGGSDEGMGNTWAKDMAFVPSGIYTDPEIASVGITESEAKERGIPYKVGKALTGSNGKTLIESGERGYVKLIFASNKEEGNLPEGMEDGSLIGAQIVAKRATDMIGALTIAVTSGTKLEDLEKVIWPHPTFSEVIGEAVEDAGSGAIHAMPKKKR